MRSYNTKGLYLTPQREEVIRGAYEFGKLTYLEGREYLIKDNPEFWEFLQQAAQYLKIKRIPWTILSIIHFQYQCGYEDAAKN